MANFRSDPYVILGLENGRWVLVQQAEWGTLRILVRNLAKKTGRTHRALNCRTNKTVVEHRG